MSKPESENKEPAAEKVSETAPEAVPETAPGLINYCQITVIVEGMATE